MLTPKSRSTSPAGRRVSGAHRIITPQETVEWLRPLLPVLGITRVANVTGLDRIGVPVVMVCRPNARSLSVSQGKGLSLAAARASGLMESIEQYHAEQITLPLKLTSWSNLRLEGKVVDLDRFPRLELSRFHPDLRLLWIESRDMVSGESVFLPFEMVHLDLTLPLPSGSGCFPLGSNGLASGNHPFEACIHAICELVERDAKALWLAGGEASSRSTRLDLATVDDDACREILARYDAAEVFIAAWEMTSDLGIAAFNVEILDAKPQRQAPLFAATGMGCHGDRGVALQRALTEAAQARVTWISGSRDDLGRGRYRQGLDPDVLDATLVGLKEMPPQRRFGEVPTWSGESLEQDLSWLLDRLVAAGFSQVLAVDLTKPGLEVPVIRVVIPGLEGFAAQPGYVPGPRLRAFLEQQRDSR